MIAARQNAQSPTAGRRTPQRREHFRCNELQLVGDAMETLCVAEEQISSGGQMFSERVDNFYFCFPLKIDQHVAAENQIKRTGDGIGFPSEIEPLKPNDVAEFFDRLDFAFFGAKTL